MIIGIVVLGLIGGSFEKAYKIYEVGGQNR